MSFSMPKIDKAPPPPKLPDDKPAELKVPEDDGNAARKRQAQGRAALRIDPVATAQAASGTGLNIPRL